MSGSSLPDPREMPILEHFQELRGRLLKSVIALLLTTLASFALTPWLIKQITQPIGGLDKLQSIELTENIGVFMRVSLLSGVIFAMPVIVYQILMFVVPGLTKSERRWVGFAVPTATLLFAGGVAFAYFILLPPAVRFLVSFLGVQTVPRLSNYISFVTGILFWMGIVFQYPLLIFILAKLKLVTGRMLLRSWRVAFVLIAILAALITPTGDPVNMALMMVPLLVLYLLGILLAFLA